MNTELGRTIYSSFLELAGLDAVPQQYAMEFEHAFGRLINDTDAD